MADVREFNYFVDEKTVKQWIALFETTTAVRIARTYGVHPNTVRYHLRKAGISRKGVNAVKTENIQKFANKRRAACQ